MVHSSRAGVGKSLVVQKLAEKLTELPNNKTFGPRLVRSLCPIIPLHGTCVNRDQIVRSLLSHAVKRDIPVSRIFHLDISKSVRTKLIRLYLINATN